MATDLTVPAAGVRRSPVTLAWCLVYNRAAGRDEVLVRWNDGDRGHEAQLSYWLSLDDREQVYTAKFVRWPAEMDPDTRDELREEVVAYHTNQSTDAMFASRAQVEKAVSL